MSAGCRTLLLALLLAAACLGTPPAALCADHQLLDEIYEEEELKEDDGVSTGEYLTFLKDRVLRKLANALESSAWIVWGSPAVLWALVAVFGVFLAFQLLRLLVRWRRGGRVDDAPTILPAQQLPAESPEDLRERLERLMAAGKTRAALRTLWLFFATELDRRGVGRFETETTNREFVNSVATLAPGWSHLRRLREFSSATERLLYSGAAVEMDELRPLVSSAREMLA